MLNNQNKFYLEILKLDNANGQYTNKLLLTIHIIENIF